MEFYFSDPDKSGAGRRGERLAGCRRRGLLRFLGKLGLLRFLGKLRCCYRFYYLDHRRHRIDPYKKTETAHAVSVNCF